MILEIGQRYAYREHPRSWGGTLIPVKAVKLGAKKASRMVQICRLDGEHEGMEEWIPKVRLVVRWEEAEAFLEHEDSVFAANESCGQVKGTPEWEAVEEVFMAFPGSLGMMLGLRGGEQELLVIDDLDGVATRLAIDKEEMLAEVLSSLVEIAD